jgi:hypothetical protein
VSNKNQLSKTIRSKYVVVSDYVGPLSTVAVDYQTEQFIGALAFWRATFQIYHYTLSVKQFLSIQISKTV